MAVDDLGSRSDLEALQRSGRGKVVVLALLLLAALGAAGWYFFLRKQGIGSPENPTKVLVVRTGRMIGYAAVLEQDGFDAAEGDLGYWVGKAQAQLPDLETAGVEAVLQLADHYGYGYIVFEDPQTVDFSAIDVEVPALPEHVRFAVVSVGDFAFPHVMTVNPEPSLAIRSTKITLLRALFAQERLAALTPEDEADLGVEDIQLRSKLEEALAELAKLPAAEKLAERVLADTHRLLVEDERAEPAPTLVGQALEDGEAVPLPSGGVLAMTRGLRVVTPDAVHVELEPVEEERLLYRPAQGTADAREVCRELAGGTLAATEAVRINFAPDGTAALVKTLTDGSSLWVHKSGTPCGFTNMGSVPPPAAGVDGAPAPHASGKVAQVGFADGKGIVRVVGAGGGPSQDLGLVDGIEFGGVIWLDATHLAALGDGPSVFLFSLEHPETVLELDGAAFDGASRLGELAVLRGTTRDILVTAGNAPRKLYRVTLPADPAALFAAPPKLVAAADEAEPGATAADDDATQDDESDPPADTAPGEETDPTPVVELDPSAFTIVALTHEGNVANPTSSPDGTLVAFAIFERSLDRPDAAADDEIAVLPVDGGPLRLLTRNALTDGRPRFTADGRHLVFLTRAKVPKTRWEINTPRIVPVPVGP